MAVELRETETRYEASPGAVSPRALADQLPLLAGEPALTRSSPAVDVVLAYLRAQVTALAALDPVVRENGPDAAHQMRITTRRLRSTFRTFGAIIRRTETKRLAGELQWLGGVLGGVRDTEVISAHLRDRLHQTPPQRVIGPVQARIQGHYASARATAQEKLLAALDSVRYFSLRDELDKLVADPPLGALAGDPAGDVLPTAVHRAYRRTRKRMVSAWEAPAGPAREAALHEARKAARRARYASEAVIPVCGKKAKRFGKQMKRVQSVLGDHQDTVIARPAARALGISAHLAGENALTYGLLYEKALHEGELLQVTAREVWQRAARGRYRRWMR
jgi:CHAD domain-containing protein